MPDVYGDDRVFVYLRNGDDPSAELDDAVDTLTDAGHADADAQHR